MNHEELSALSDRIETASASDPQFVGDLLKGLSAAFSDLAGSSIINAGIVVSTDTALGLINKELPGWVIAIQGQALAHDGHWKCTLRKSDTRDDDELMGIGKARTVPLALLGALLRVAARRTLGYR